MPLQSLLGLQPIEPNAYTPPHKMLPQADLRSLNKALVGTHCGLGSVWVVVIVGSIVGDVNLA